MKATATLATELELLHTLYQRTRQHELTWSPHDARGDVVLSDLDGYRITLAQLPDADYPNQPDYELIISEADGREVERVSTISLRPIMDRTSADGLPPYAVLESLYDLAHDQAFEVNHVVGKLLRKLQDK